MSSYDETMILIRKRLSDAFNDLFAMGRSYESDMSYS